MIEDKPIVEQEMGFAMRDAPQSEGVQVAALGNISRIFKDVLKTKDMSAQGVVGRYRDRKGQTQAPSKEQIDMILGTQASGTGAPPPAPPPPRSPFSSPSPDVVRGVAEEYGRTAVPTEKIPEEAGINVRRHHQGGIANPDLDTMDPDVALENMETADDIARLLEASGKVQNLKEGPRTHAELEARTDTFEKAKSELKQIFEADPDAIGALTDVQLLAARRMLSTLGDQTVALSDRISGGDNAPETLLQFQKKMEAFTALHSFTRGKVREAARALAQQRVIAKTLNGHDIEQVADFIEMGSGYRTPEDVIVQADNLSRRARNQGNDEAMNDAMKPDFRDYFKAGVEYWSNNILSGLETQIVNLTSSPLVMLYETMVVNNLAAAIGKARTSLGVGASERVTSQEQVARMTGGAIGLRDGMTAFWDALVKGEQSFGPEKGEEVRGAMTKVFGYHGEQLGDLIPGATAQGGRRVGEGAATAMTLSFRGLTAGDALWKTTIFRDEFTAQLVREAYAKEVKDVGKYLLDAFENPEKHKEAYDAAMDLARRYTFTDTDRPGKLGDMARALKKYATQHPYIKFITPFIDTPINLVHYAVENSALAPLSTRLWQDFQAGGAKADIAAARVIAGLGMTMLAIDLTSDESYVGTLTGGKLVGEGPPVFSQREPLEMTNYEPNSFFVDNTYYGIDRLDPFAMMIFSIVNTIEKAKYAKEEYGFTEGIIKAALEIANHATNATYAKGVNDVMNVMQGRKDVDKWIASYVSGFDPYSGTQKTIARLIDPQPKALLDDKGIETTLSDIIDQKIDMQSPMRRGGLGPDRYWDGSMKHPRNGKPVYMMDILDYAEEIASPVKVKQGRKSDAATNALIENGLGPTMAEPVVTYNGVTFSLLSLDNEAGLLYDAYAVHVGKARREAIEGLIKTSAFKSATSGYNSEQRIMLGSALLKGKKKGFDEFVKKELRQFVAKNPEKASEFAETFVAMGIAKTLRLAKMGVLKPDLQEKFKVKGISERGALPLPPHVEQMPEF